MSYRIYIIIFVIFSFMIFPSSLKAQQTDTPQTENQNADYAPGLVLKIVSELKNDTLTESMGGNQIIQKVKIKVLNGQFKGKIIDIDNQLTSSPAYDIKVRAGDKIILDIDYNIGDNGKITPVFNIADRERFPALTTLAAIFFGLILLIGGKQGIKSIISLSVTTLLILFILVPAILHNYPIIPITVGITFVSTIFIAFLVGGINLKSISAIIGTLGGVFIAGIISMLTIKFAPLSGLTDNEAVILWSSRPDLNFTALLTSGMIISALGAIMDVGISIASSISEVKSINPSLSMKQLIESGMNVGRDIMGAMSNTLILAYIGGALPLILLSVNAPLIKLLNLNSIVTEIVAALAGSIGIVLCVPITAIVAGYLMSMKFKEKSKENSFAKTKLDEFLLEQDYSGPAL